MEALAKKTGIPSERLLSRPKLRPDVIRTWNAYQELADTRGYNSVGPQPISMQDMLTYAGLLGLKLKDEVALFCSQIRRMDTAQRGWHAKTQERRTKPVVKGKK